MHLLTTFILFILFNIFVTIFGHALLSNCINGCSKSYDPNKLCINFSANTHIDCITDILDSFNICTNMCKNFYYSYNECSEYCIYNKIVNDCYKLLIN